MSENNNKIGYVYILTNPAMPEWVKIGQTCDVNARLKSLNEKSAVPLSFCCYAKLKTEKYIIFEKQIHNIIDAINPGLRSREISEKGNERVREFFRLPAPTVAGLFKNLMDLMEIPRENLIYSNATQEEIVEEVHRQRRERTTFEMLNIPINSELVFNKDDKTVVKTHDMKNAVEYNGEIRSISSVAGELLKRPSGAANGFEWFNYNGDSLWNLRLALQNED